MSEGKTICLQYKPQFHDPHMTTRQAHSLMRDPHGFQANHFHVPGDVLSNTTVKIMASKEPLCLLSLHKAPYVIRSVGHTCFSNIPSGTKAPSLEVLAQPVQSPLTTRSLRLVFGH